MCPPAGRDITNNNEQQQRPPSSQRGQNTPHASGNSQMQLQMQYQQQEQQQPPVHPEASKLQQYKRVEALAMILRNDKDSDMRIHESTVLIARCQALESGYLLGRWGLPDGRSENPFGLSPLITGIVELLKDQMAKFERIFVSWHSPGPFLEKAIASVVGASVAAASKHCGMLSGIPCIRIESGQHIIQPVPNCPNGGGLTSSSTSKQESLQNAQTMLEATISWFRDILGTYMQHEGEGK